MRLRKFTIAEAEPHIGAMLFTRKKMGTNEPKEYSDTPEELHVFIWNVTRHANEPLVRFWSIGEIMDEFRKLFPDLMRDMFWFMHKNRLHSQLGPARDAPMQQCFSYATRIILKEKDKDGKDVKGGKDVGISVPDLLRACNYIHYFLARFEDCSTRFGFTGASRLVNLVAVELVNCITSLANVKEPVYTPATTKKNIAIVKLIWFVSAALNFSVQVQAAQENPTARVTLALKLALEKVLNDIISYGQIPFKVNVLHSIQGVKWPNIFYVQMLVGNDFVTSQKRWKETMSEIAKLSPRLVKMIEQRPATSAIARIIVLSPFPVIVALLIDPRIMNSGLGHLALAAVLVCDVLNVIQILGSTTYRIYTSHFGVPLIILTLIESLLVTIASAFSRVTFLKVIQLTPEGKPVKNYYISLICSGVLVSAIACDKLACSFILPHLLTSTVHSYILCNQDGFMILPCAIKMDLAVFYDFAFLKSVLVNVSVVAASKLLGVCGAAMLIKVPIRDAVNLCIIMATQGIVQGALYESIYKLQAHIV
ncbi:hypothetical protein POM88_009867 [Heracleum sosnowskyi]|uniref:Uncharacterized protein n=1 Tax=Heracleum sosnowskyi TaxID=360622 RepID=A0AAD8JAP6_9APIA|nr:hypothetical protein POM88_009867 [Heracleum sosnowskyi]